MRHGEERKKNQRAFGRLSHSQVSYYCMGLFVDEARNVYGSPRVGILILGKKTGQRLEDLKQTIERGFSQ